MRVTIGGDVPGRVAGLVRDMVLGTDDATLGDLLRDVRRACDAGPVTVAVRVRDDSGRHDALSGTWDARDLPSFGDLGVVLSSVPCTGGVEASGEGIAVSARMRPSDLAGCVACAMAEARDSDAPAMATVRDAMRVRHVACGTAGMDAERADWAADAIASAVAEAACAGRIGEGQSVTDERVAATARAAEGLLASWAQTVPGRAGTRGGDWIAHVAAQESDDAFWGLGAACAVTYALGAFDVAWDAACRAHPSLTGARVDGA